MAGWDVAYHQGVQGYGTISAANAQSLNTNNNEPEVVREYERCQKVIFQFSDWTFWLDRGE